MKCLVSYLNSMKKTKKNNNYFFLNINYTQYKINFKIVPSKVSCEVSIQIQILMSLCNFTSNQTKHYFYSNNIKDNLS